MSLFWSRLVPPVPTQVKDGHPRPDTPPGPSVDAGPSSIPQQEHGLEIPGVPWVLRFRQPVPGSDTRDEPRPVWGVGGVRSLGTPGDSHESPFRFWTKNPTSRRVQCFDRVSVLSPSVLKVLKPFLREASLVKDEPDDLGSVASPMVPGSPVCVLVTPNLWVCTVSVVRRV